MARRGLEPVVEAFGADPELLPLLPALFADFEALGGWPDKIVAVLRESAELPEQASVVDLGCAKGAVSIAIARELGYRVRGIDLFGPFLEEAAAAAGAAGVGRLCSFEVADIREIVQELDVFDVTVFAAVGAGLFGDYSGCVGALRRCTRHGGYMVISDGFLRKPLPPAAEPAGYGYYEPQDVAVRQLAGHGDLMVRELLVSRQELAQQSRHDLERIRRSVHRLSAAEPQYREQLQKFLASQEAEYDFLNQATVEAVWLLRRA